MNTVSAASAAPLRTMTGITTPVSRGVGPGAKISLGALPASGSAALLSRTSQQAPGLAQSAAMKAKAQLQHLSLTATAPLPATTPGTGPMGLRGDVDADGVVTASDSKALLDYLFRGSSPAGLANADVNADGKVDVSDVVQLFDLLQPVSGGGPGGSSAPVTPVTLASTPTSDLIAKDSTRLAVSAK